MKSKLATIIMLAALVGAMAIGSAGCIQVGGDKPLVDLGAKGASSSPTAESAELSRLRNENRRLQMQVAELEKELAATRSR